MNSSRDFNERYPPGILVRKVSRTLRERYWKMFEDATRGSDSFFDVSVFSKDPFHSDSEPSKASKSHDLQSFEELQGWLGASRSHPIQVMYVNCPPSRLGLCVAEQTLFKLSYHKQYRNS